MALLQGWRLAVRPAADAAADRRLDSTVIRVELRIMAPSSYLRSLRGSNWGGSAPKSAVIKVVGVYCFIRSEDPPCTPHPPTLCWATSVWFVSSQWVRSWSTWQLCAAKYGGCHDGAPQHTQPYAPPLSFQAARTTFTPASFQHTASTPAPCGGARVKRESHCTPPEPPWVGLRKCELASSMQRLTLRKDDVNPLPFIRGLMSFLGAKFLWIKVRRGEVDKGICLTNAEGEPLREGLVRPPRPVLSITRRLSLRCYCFHHNCVRMAFICL